MTWGLNLGYNNVTNAVNMAQSIFQTFSPTSETTKGGVTLDFIELGMSRRAICAHLSDLFGYVVGNEPDLYLGHVRPSDWTVSQYVEKSVLPSHLPCTGNSATYSWVESMIPIMRAVNLTVGGPVSVLGCSFASQKFTVAGSIAAGMLDSEPGKYITQCVSFFLSSPLTRRR